MITRFSALDSPDIQAPDKYLKGILPNSTNFFRHIVFSNRSKTFSTHPMTMFEVAWWEEIKPPIEQKSKNIFCYVCYENETNHVKKYDVWPIWRTFSHVRTTFSHENIESRKKSWKVRWDSLEGFQISRNQIQKVAKYKLFLLIWSVNCKYFCDSASDDNEI